MNQKVQPPNPNLHVFALAILSAILQWLAFPPASIWWLGWLGTAPLIWLILLRQLPGERPYRQLLLVGFLYWLAAYYYIRIPHPLLNIAWLALAGYFAVYTPVFVGVSRTLIHRFRIPAIVAVPIVWTGIEWLRTNLFTGLGMGCLSQSQYKQPELIQIADLSGAYTVSFVMLVFATGITTTVFRGWQRRWQNGDDSLVSFSLWQTAWPASVSVLLLLATLGYGNFRLTHPLFDSSEKTINVALIQPSIDVVFRPISDEERNARWQQHGDLTRLARRKWSDLDLIVWPESSFDSPDLLSDYGAQSTAEYFRVHNAQLCRMMTGNGAGSMVDVPLLTGISTHDPAQDRIYNSASLFATDGQVVERYHKSHRVLFGEYVPFAEWFPVLDRLTPIGKGLSRGEAFKTIEIDGVTLAPSVCFESCVPHYIARQVRTLTEQGNDPDVLVNVTNDGWFYGTACLDIHLANNVFRSIELRKPTLVAANTGFSAEIDSCGRLLQVGPRRETAVLKATVGPVNRTSLYRSIGDTIPMVFGVLTIVVALIEGRRMRQTRRAIIA